MLIRTAEVCEGLITLCLTDDEGNEYIYLNDIEEDSIRIITGYTKLGDNGLRIITDMNEYQIEFN